MANETNTTATGMGDASIPDGYTLFPTSNLTRMAETLEHDGDEHGVARDIRAMVAASPALASQPAPVGDIPFDTVAKVVEALLWLGHSAPESKEEQAARSVSLVNTLCREVLSTKAQPAPVVGNELYNLVAQAIRSTGMVTNTDKWEVAESVITALSCHYGWKDESRG